MSKIDSQIILTDNLQFRRVGRDQELAAIVGQLAVITTLITCDNRVEHQRAIVPFHVYPGCVQKSVEEDRGTF